MRHSPNRLFTTDVGTFVIWANNDHQVGLRTEWNHNHGYSQYKDLDMSQVNNVVTLSRVDYAVTVFVEKYARLAEKVGNQTYRVRQIGDTTWAVDTHDTNMLTRNQADAPNYHGTQAASEALYSKVIVPLCQWLDTDEGKAFVASGQEVDDTITVESIDKKLVEIDEAQRQLLLIKAKVEQGRPITDDQHYFARYANIPVVGRRNR